MRISDRGLAGSALLFLAACSDPAATTANTQVLARAEAEQGRAAAEDGRILCARRGGAMRRTCTVDREQGDTGLVLVVRHDDGGFHRLLVTRDGRGVVAADGAQPARVTIPEPGSIDVAIGGDTYRLPATIKGA